MKKILTQENPFIAVLVLAGIWLLFGWYALSLALFHAFLTPLLTGGLLLCTAATAFVGFRFLKSSPWDFRLVFIGAALSAIFIGTVAIPTVFSGRDQGSISEAAYRLAQNGRLVFTEKAGQSFFDIYGPGPALNFPGFSYTPEGDLLTQFPLGYTSFLAGFVTLFGLSGLTVANALLFFLFLLVFYAGLRLFTDSFYALAGLALANFSFLPTWFAKHTLSENFALFLFVSLLYALFMLLRKPGPFTYGVVFLAAGLLPFTRIEGFVIMPIVAVICFLQPDIRAFWRKHPFSTLVLPGVVFLFFLLRDFFLNLPYYKVIGKALAKFLDNSGSGLIREAGSESLSLVGVFFSYGILLTFFVGLVALVFLFKEKKYALLIPALLAAPAFLYLIVPSITPDHPWMLRRYLFALFPVLLFSATVGIGLAFASDRTLPIVRPRGRRFFIACGVFAILLAFQLPAWMKSIAFAEQRSLLEQTERFSQSFGANDLVLVDRFATGSGFSMLSGPGQSLFGKNIVYFFNPFDLERLDLMAYDRIFLVTPSEQSERYQNVLGSRMKLAGRHTFTLQEFASAKASGPIPGFPEKRVISTENLIYEIIK